MQVKQLQAAMAPFKLLCSKNAMAPHYQALEISATRIRGCSPFGRAEVKIDTGTSATFYVNAWTFINVIGSLNGEATINFLPDQAVLGWQAGPARGRLAMMAIADMPEIEYPAATGRAQPKQIYKLNPSFVNSLSLGALSCGDTSMATVGAYGVVIDSIGTPMIYATDNTTASCCLIDGDPLPGHQMVTLSPDAAELLIACCNTTGALEFSATSVYYTDDWIRLQVNQVPKLQKDLGAIFNNYKSTDITARISPEAIAAFVKRANAISESRRDTHVVLSASKGQLGLSFDQGTASADEVYLVENLDIPDLAEIQLDAAKLARALQHVDEVVLDHIKRGVVVLRGGKPEFRYLISGRR